MKLWLLYSVIVCLNASEEDLDFTNVDVASLATNAYGTELLLLENARYTDQNSYKFEDFFWTGSGDGDDDREDLWTTEEPAVVYRTSTVVSTVFIHTPPTQTVHDDECKTSNCTPAAPGPLGEITPSPTFPISNASQQFWLLTVLKGDGKDPVIVDLKNSLARLYKIAFERQQERHLGILTRQKRNAVPDKPVNVYIHEVNKQNGDGKIEVVYHVEMLGKPVDAHTAANDMTLVSDQEVTAELGYPLEIKAEPYVKFNEPQSLSKSRNTWFVIGVSMITVLVLLLVLAFFLLGVAKRKGHADAAIGIENKRHIFERGVGVENKGLVRDDETLSESQPVAKNSPTYIHFGEQHVTSVVLREQSSFSGVSSSSSSLDISPLMSVGKKRKVTPRKLSRPRAAHNKTTPLRPLPPEVFDSDSGSSRKGNSPSDFRDNFDPGVMSPKSFLSMPSVKSFPRTNMPEPLNRVLEPVSVTNLDMPDGGLDSAARKSGSETLLRHGSVGTMEDPGVIGPIVWRMHSDRLKHGLNDLDLKTTGNVSRMRKRFHDLLDDTFSLFGTSRKSSPVNTPVDDRSRPIAIEVKSHSANDNRPVDATLPQRPKTTGGSKPPHAPGPSYAWCSTAPSPLVRPVSAAPKIGASTSPAGILKPPRVNVEHVLAEGAFRPSDPAISVIEAIKSELEKVSLPGSPGD